MPLRTRLDHILDDSAIAPNDFMYFGSGNYPTDFQIQGSGYFEAGIKAHYRTSPTTLVQAVGPDGKLYSLAPTGPQVVDPAHGVSSANPNRAAWSIDFSMSTGAGSGGNTLQYELSHGTQMFLKIDLDPSAKTKFMTLEARYDATLNPNGSHIVWEDTKTHTVVIGDDQGTDFVTQNSFNYAFYASLIDTNPGLAGIQPYAFGPAQFEIQQQVVKNGVTLINNKDIVLVGQDAPANAILLDQRLDDNAINPLTGNLFSGSGNPATSFDIDRNESQHTELGLNFHYRTSVVGLNQAVEAEDVFNFSPTGTQVVDPDHGVFSAHTGRAVANFDYSFLTDTDGSGKTLQQFLADGGVMQLRIDTDIREDKVKYLDLHAVYDAAANPGGSHIVWRDNAGNTFIGDDAGNSVVTQNSQNMAFYKNFIDGDLHTKGLQPYNFGTAEFDIDIRMLDSGMHVLNEVHEVLRVEDSGFLL